MKTGKLAERMAKGKPAIGTAVGLRDSLVTIIMANADFDWVWIDQEHNPFTEIQLQMMIYSLKDRDLTPVIRVRENTEGYIKIALDMGAGGVLVPQLETVDDFRKAVKYAKYPPLGKRGYGPMHATDFWKHKKQYDEEANTMIKLICQIEFIDLVNRIDEVFQVEGIDAFFIGPADLAWSMGLKGDSIHPDVEQAIGEIAKAAQRHGTTWGMPASDAAACKKLYDLGARLLSVGADRSFMINGAKQELAEARRLLTGN